MEQKIKRNKIIRRRKRVRAKMFGTANQPRFSVFRSNKHIYVQLIDDAKGKTIFSINDLELKKKRKGTDDKTVIKSKIELKGKLATAYLLGKLVAKKALEKKIKKVIFDRGSYKYHGRVKAVAEGARMEGLEF